jgi:hypothetical protein
VPGLLFAIFLITYRYFRKMEATMLQSRSISAEASFKSAEVAAKLADMLEKEHHA